MPNSIKKSLTVSAIGNQNEKWATQFGKLLQISNGMFVPIVNSQPNSQWSWRVTLIIYFELMDFLRFWHQVQTKDTHTCKRSRHLCQINRFYWRSESLALCTRIFKFEGMNESIVFLPWTCTKLKFIYSEKATKDLMKSLHQPFFMLLSKF